MAIYISGSLAYDRVMNFPGTFGDYIIPEKIHMLNVCFPIEKLEEKRGGTGGNIAYNLALLGEQPIILATAGKDFGSYKSFLERIGVNLEGVRALPDEYTPGAYITTDLQANQITGFHAAAMNFPCAYTFPRLNPQNDIAIIAPSNPEDMEKHARLYHERGVRFIFDPGQQLTSLTREALIAGITGALLLISNDYELDLFMQISGLDLDGILRMTPTVITTLGEKGSRIRRRDGSTSLTPALPIRKLENPTGAGDAYRAGLVKGIIQGWELEQSCLLGAACAAFCVERYSTQEHYFDASSLRQRIKDGAGTALPIEFASLALPPQ